MLKSLLCKKLEEFKEVWYILIVAFGREVEVKNKLVLIKDEIGMTDILIPEKIKDDADNDVYQCFLGYVFIKANIDIEKYSTILGIDAIYRFLGRVIIVSPKVHVYIPYKVPEKEIEHTRSFLTGKKKIKDITDIEKGDKVLIVKGDLSNIKGKVLEINKTTVKVLPESFFQNVIVVPRTSIIKILT